MHETSSTRITPTGRWLVLAAALLGWLFDGAEMGLFSLVGRDAIRNLMGGDESQVGPVFGLVVAVFLVGAATGGVLFGWLGDRIGRVRAMSLSVLTYALFTGFCGLATSTTQLAVLRFIAALGMGGEWALGVALVMEVWPNRSRALMAGLIGAAANVGYVLVALLSLALASVLDSLKSGLPSLGISADWTAYLTADRGWRIMMMSGTVPALLTFVFRLFVPESEKWEQQHAKGSTSHWQTSDLFGVLFGSLGPLAIVVVWSPQFADQGLSGLGLTRGIVTVLGLMVATYGYLYPVLRFLRRSDIDPRTVTPPLAAFKMPEVRLMLFGAGLSGIALLGTWGSTQWVPTWAGGLVQQAHVGAGWTEAADHAKEYSQLCTATGAVVGTVLAALCGDWFGRRLTYFGMCLLSMVSVMWMFLGHHQFDGYFLFAAFIAGGITASFYGWLPLYLPELFGTRFRATGQGFAFNFGRIIAAVGVLQAGVLTQAPKISLGGFDIPAGYPLACSAMSFIYIIGMGLIWFLPETKGRPLPD